MTIRQRTPVARTPLFAAVHRALRAACTTQSEVQPTAEQPEPREKYPRREFMKRAAAGSVLLSLGAPLLASCASNAPRVAIVGAGLAGLNAAYVLKKAGVSAAVYDASNRAGGRILTARDAVGPGMHAELGGEFIDLAHADMLALVKEFGLELLDSKPANLANFQSAYFFGGRHFSAAQRLEALKPLAERLTADARAVGRNIDYEHASETAKRFDGLSLSAYLDHLGAQGWSRDLVQVACVTEFGLDADQQSALNFLATLSTDRNAGRGSRVGDSEPRYVINGGNEQITQALTQRLEPQLRLQHKFEMVKRRGDGYSLQFRDANGVSKEERADIVILALPFSLLREASIDVPLPDVKRKAIEELGYGSSAKMLVGFEQRVWRNTQHNGELFTDEPVQSSWEHSVRQPGQRAGMTFYLGGRSGVELGHDSPERQVNRLVVGLERAFPGARNARGEKIIRWHWPTQPFSKGSIACYRVGQWTSIAGAEAAPVGKLFFAGEHCSRDFRGSMNGAAESGRHVAESVIALLRS